tara:strand:+ start:101787 stop:101912 length:126 start_codon:yes stop_codon:yes gene_type:complete
MARRHWTAGWRSNPPVIFGITRMRAMPARTLICVFPLIRLN